MAILNKDGLSYLWIRIKEKLNTKVDKVSGKSLISDTEITRLANVTNYDDTTTKADITALQNGKVDKVSGKQLSTNDYTNAEKTKLSGFQTADKYALKTDIVNVYKYKGSVTAYADLPTENVAAGDIYDVQSDGMNYAWTGTKWDALGSTFTIDAITNEEIDDILAQ